MRVTPIRNPLVGERVVSVQPAMKPMVNAEWHRRLNLYSGRSLSDTALSTEQSGRAGRLATRGQALSPGVVSGLAVGLERPVFSNVIVDVEDKVQEKAINPRDQFFYHIASGTGLTASGEDIVVSRNIRVGVGAVPVYTTVELLTNVKNFGSSSAQDQLLAVPTDKLFGDKSSESDAGQQEALKPRRLGPSLNELIDAQVALPRAGVLVLQPIVLKRAGEYDAEDPCEQDPQNYAFEDWQLVDGCQLILYAWPYELTNTLPLPEFDGQWRNHLAYTIFEAEMNNGPEQLLPWEELGVPIGLVGFSETFLPLFVDRYAVVRAGGKPKRRSVLVPDVSDVKDGQGIADAEVEWKLTALMPNAGHPFIWQARIQQFAEQMNEALGGNTSIENAAKEFQFLPPVGVLPKDALELKIEQCHDHFFPGSFQVSAVPVPLEQLDVAVEQSASLKFFDTFQPDEVRVLVPVPQIYYEPNLLTVEEEDQEFLENIATSQRKLGKWLRRRLDVDEIAQALNAEIKGANTVYPEFEMMKGEVADQDPLDKDDPNDKELNTLEGMYGTITKGGKLLATVYDALQTEFNQDNSFMKKELFEKDGQGIPTINRLDQKGLQGFIAFLEEKVKRADDIIDFGFVRVQTDIYRVRQLVLGNVAATRLATSPALAAIAKGKTALATREDIINFVQSAKKQQQPGFLPIAAAATHSGPDGGSGSGTAAHSLIMNQPKDGDAHVSGEAAQGVAMGLLGAPAMPVEASVQSAGGLGGFFDFNVSDIAKTASVSTQAKQKQATYTTFYGAKTASRDAVLEQSPIIGHALDFRSVTVAERIKEAPAPEAKNFSVASKYEVVKALIELSEIIVLDDLLLPGFHDYDNANSAVKVNLVQLVDEKGRPLFDDQRKPITKSVPIEKRFTITEIKSRNLHTEILQSRHDLDPVDGDETAFFAAGVRTMDHTVAILRLVEGRIQSYRNIIEECKKVLSALNGLVAQVNSRVKVLEGHLAEMRHDLSVAKALEAEEQARVASINERRRKILAEQVPFLVYQRQRVSDLLAETKVRALDPGLVESPVPACLARDVQPPPELRAMIDLLRGAPIKWFVNVHTLLERFDRLEHLQTAVLHAKARANMEYPALPQATQALLLTGLFGQAIHQVITAQKQVVAQYRVQTAQLDVSALAAQSWTLTRDRAREVISLGDLIDGQHGRSDVSQQAARELENINHIAACLYSSLGVVLPVIRLEWAERISQFDAPLDLRNLAVLPRWGEIKYLDRREMQTFVDWLCSRVDAKQAEALTLINDIVRICILLASHAPVNQIISGHVPRQTEVKEGGRVDLAVDLAKARVGMHVLMYNELHNVVARGVIEDLSQEQATAHVTQVHTTTKTVTLVENAHVQIAEAGAFDRNPLTIGQVGSHKM